MSPTKSLRDSINAFCRSCIFDPTIDGTWQKQVKACKCVNCPLFPVRHGARVQSGREVSSLSPHRAEKALKQTRFERVGS
jgi:hypothetical protein